MLAMGTVMTADLVPILQPVIWEVTAPTVAHGAPWRRQRRQRRRRRVVASRRAPIRVTAYATMAAPEANSRSVRAGATAQIADRVAPHRRTTESSTLAPARSP